MTSYGPWPTFKDKLRTPISNLNDKPWTPYPFLNDKSWPLFPSFSDNFQEKDVSDFFQNFHHMIISCQYVIYVQISRHHQQAVKHRNIKNYIQDYAIKNEMKINSSKTKFMVFNPTLSFDLIPDKKLDNKSLDTVESMKLLGLVVSNDLTWKSNTEYLTKKAYGRLWAIQRLVKNGASLEDLVDIYNKQVRSVLEFGVPVWNSSLTKEEVKDIERVQKSFHQIALGTDFLNYADALDQTGLDTLEIRRTKLCLGFAKKAAKHTKHSHWFAKRNDQRIPNTRNVKLNFSEPTCRLERFRNSPIPYLTRILNEQ